MFVGYSEDHAGDPHQKNYHEQRCEMVEHNMETLQNEKHQCKKTGGTFPG